MTEQLDPELKKAVALFYDGSGAPQVTAKGIGDEAEAILHLAAEHGVPLCDNAALVELLTQIEVGDNIPENLYLAVAHIVSFAQKIRLAEAGQDPRPASPVNKPNL